MLNKRSFGLLVAAVMLLAVILVACQPASPEVITEVVEVTRMVTETVVQEGETVEVTRVVTEEVVVEVPSEPEEAVLATFASADPTTLLEMTFADVDTLDPSLAYDTASSGVLRQTMEALITYNGNDSTTYVPSLALEVPSLENGLISEDGLTYTFNIREGVTFHEGGEMTPSDVAYTFQRGLLQSDPNGPQWLWLEPIMGYGSGDITENIADGAYAGDREGLITDVSAEELAAVCEEVKERVVADDEAGTVTFNLAQPWGPLLATFPDFGYILDMEWVVENGGWDGDCATWQNWYAPGSENSELSPIVNGTGPYKLDHWTPGEEWVVVANDNYWRTDDDPVWEGGPAGAPEIKTIIRRIVGEWGTRFAALQAGDAVSVSVPEANRPQADEFVGEFCDWKTGECVPNEENPNGSLRKWGDLPGVRRTNVFPSFDTGVESPYIGSGQLDGNGIPPDFFSDIHVRKALAYCIDYDVLLSDGYNGEGVRNNGVIIQGMLGYNEDGPMYEFDLDACAAELEQAWDGQLPETGFRFSTVYNTGNVARRTAAEMLQANMRSINPLYQVDVVALPWPTILRTFRVGQNPITFSGWLEDIHDPHNWVQPFTYGTYGGRQNLPDELKAQFRELAVEAVLSADPAEREQIYFDLGQLFYDEAVSVPLIQSSGARYEQRYTDGYTFRVGLSVDNPFYYGMSLDGGE
jgi:peptide/nickel transport system substrate-binding protein